MSNLSEQPLVSIITPVYNGEEYLSETIESVLNQTYENWEYIIQNNSSTDSTLEIATEYAKKDARIRIHTTESLIPPVDNHNTALELMSESSAYCKFVHADDTLMPECIEKMVKVAKQSPQIGLVSSYGIWGERLWCDGLPHTRSHFKGAEVIRTILESQFAICVFGCPSTILIRSDLAKTLRPLFNAKNPLHYDIEVCFEILKHSDLGFAHDVLTFIRRHDAAISSTKVVQYDSDILSQYASLHQYGKDVFSESEFNELDKKYESYYYSNLSKHFIKLKFKTVLEYHKKTLAVVNLTIKKSVLTKYILLRAIDSIAYIPVKIVKAIRSLF